MTYWALGCVQKCDLWACQRKEKRQKLSCVKLAICPDHPRWRRPLKFCVRGRVWEVVIYFKFLENRSSGLGAVGGRKLPSPIDKAHGLYNSLYYHTSRVWKQNFWKVKPKFLLRVRILFCFSSLEKLPVSEVPQCVVPAVAKRSSLFDLILSDITSNEQNVQITALQMLTACLQTETLTEYHWFFVVTVSDGWFPHLKSKMKIFPT